MSEVIDITSKPRHQKTDDVFKRTFRDCYHGHYIVDATLHLVTCGKCNKELNPMWVLEDLSRKDSNNRHRLLDVQRELKETEEKMHCKCDKCGKMTRIKR